MSELQFVNWRRPALLEHEGAVVESGRLRITLATKIDDELGPELDRSVSAVFRSAGDISGLAPHAIRHRAPAPAAMDAETTKWTHVDFTDPDLPWRYTPATADGSPALRPWLVLLVGTDDELAIEGRSLGYSPATTKLLAAPWHRLIDSHVFAHVQTSTTESEAEKGEPSGIRFSRLLNLRILRPQTRYTALIVPAFNAQGGDMWNESGKISNQNRPLPIFDSWSFATGEGGDFETLAGALEVRPTKGLGIADLGYELSGEMRGPLQIRGALSALNDAPPDIPAIIGPISEDLASLAATPEGTEPRWIGRPDYSSPWIEGEPTSGWGRQLEDDPRHRVHAGTGARMGVVEQEDLMRAAVEQAGALREASARIGQLAAGVHLSGRQWATDIPADWTARLAVFGAMMARLESNAGGTVADAVTGPDTHLERAVFTGAGQRMLRRSARRRTAGPDARAALRQINQGRTPEPPIDGSEAALTGEIREVLAHRAVPDDQRDRLEHYLAEVLEVARHIRAGVVENRHDEERLAAELDRGSEKLAAHLVEGLQNHFDGRCAEVVWQAVAQRTGTDASPPALGFARRMLADGAEEAYLYETLQFALLSCLAGCGGFGLHKRNDPLCTSRVRWAFVSPPPRKRPIDLDRLGAGIGAVIDPRLGRPPAWERLDKRIGGLDLTTLSPPRFPLGLDYPTWSLLRLHAKHWLLPGSEHIAADTVAALQTNPAFIDAYLLGLNRQFQAETRWRGLPTDPWGTPLCMFFGPVDPRTGRRVRDIVPFAAWHPNSILGDPTHQRVPANDSGSSTQLVVLFHSALFRRYPRTVVYLRAGGDAVTDDALAETPELVKPKDEGDASWYARREDIAPVFMGSISPELVFFVFDVAPTLLKDYLVMLDEPPAELRFGPPGSVAATATTSTDGELEAAAGAIIGQFAQARPADAPYGSGPFAGEMLDRPTRVAISGAYLDETARRNG